MGSNGSVRIEFDDFGNDGAGPDIPEAPESQAPKYRNAGVAILVVALLGVVFLGFRPSEGETAAGTNRGSTTIAPSTTTEVPTTTTTFDPDAPVLRRDIDVGSFLVQPDERRIFDNLGSVARDDDGFLSLGTSQGGQPEVYRSIDGTDWFPVEADFTDATTGFSSRFGDLISTDEGFAALRVEETLTVLELVRIASVDGVQWNVDDAFEPISIPRTNLVSRSSTLHSTNVFGISTAMTSDLPQSLLGALLSADSDVDLSNVCDFGPVAPEEIRVFVCSGAGNSAGPGVAITAADLAEPERFADLAVCVNILERFGGAWDTASFSARWADGESMTLSGTGFTEPVALADGSVALLSGLNYIAPVSEACGPFASSIPELSPPAVELIDVNGEIRRLLIPEDFFLSAASNEVFPTVGLFESGGELIAWVGGSLWRVDLGVDAWINLADIPVGEDPFVHFTPTGDGRAVAVGDDSLTIVDLTTGNFDIHRFAGELGPAAGLVYVDTDIVLATDRFGLVVAIDLPQSGAATETSASFDLVNPFSNSDIVRSQDGFFALLASSSVDSFPSLYRSDDGIAWDRVTTDVAPFVAKGDTTVIEYSNLIDTDQGFAMLRTRTTQDRLTPRFPAESITERLISNNGQRWELDRAFTAVIHDELAAPAFHVANSFGLHPDPEVVPPETGACEVVLEETARSFSERSLLIQRFGREEPTFLNVSTGVAHTQLSGARIAAFVPNGTYFEPPSFCGRFPGFSPEFPPPELEIINADDSTTQVRLPEEVLDRSELANWPEPSLDAVEGGLISIFEESVWRLDIDTLEWTEVVDLDLPASATSDYRVLDERYVILTTSMVIVADLDTNAVVFKFLEPEQNPDGQILYADDEVIIAPDLDIDGGTVRIDLNQQG